MLWFGFAIIVFFSKISAKIKPTCFIAMFSSVFVAGTFLQVEVLDF